MPNETAEVTGKDAALGLADIQDKLEWMVKGYRNPSEYFNLFRNSLLIGKESHIWFRDQVVTSYDDHDQVRKGDGKARFCADQFGQRLALAALALNGTTLGIPCIYYGSEQGFDGHVPPGNRSRPRIATSGTRCSAAGSGPSAAPRRRRRTPAGGPGGGACGGVLPPARIGVAAGGAVATARGRRRSARGAGRASVHHCGRAATASVTPDRHRAGSRAICID